MWKTTVIKLKLAEDTSFFWIAENILIKPVRNTADRLVVILTSDSLTFSIKKA